MIKIIAYQLIFLFLFYAKVYPQFTNYSQYVLRSVPNTGGIQIGPENQQIIISIGGMATFQLKNLGGSQSVRIEYKEFLSFGGYQTIQNYGNINSIGTYIKTASEISKQIGIGIFLWRVSDNFNVNHYSDSKLMIVLLNP